MQNQLLKEFEAFVRERRYNDARPTILKILNSVESAASTFGGKVSSAEAPSEVDATRFASGMTQVLTDTSHEFQLGLFLELNRYKRSLVQTFQVSGYRGTSHFINMLGTTDEKGVSIYTIAHLFRLFSALSINAMSIELFNALLKLEPKYSFPVVLGFLSEQLLFTPEAEEVRSRILASGSVWENIDPEPFTVVGIGTAYMGCSYADAPHKHDIKKCMNKIVRRWLEKTGVKAKPLPQKRTIKNRPKLVIFAEFYNSNHAMHRCYGPSIASLKEHFDTTLLIADTEINPELSALAHNVETIRFNNDQAEGLIEKLQSYEPDILYLPSIGMRFSSIAVSNVRIAPIQVMSFGHPATTHSEAMDYAILNEGFQAGNLISEKAVLTDKLVFTHRTDAVEIPPNIRLDPEAVRIAVPAWSRKVTPRFLETCQRIQRTAKKKVEFWFFPNALGYLYQAVKRRYEGMLPGSVVLPTKNYNDYIRDINQCDIFLSTFPFGATNGIIDAAIQGLPIVNMTGEEPHSQIDGILGRMIRQPEWLTAKTVDEYVEAVVKLVNDDGLRIQISRNLLDSKPEKVFFDETKEPHAGFAKTLEFIFTKHENIKGSDNKDMMV